MSDSFHQRTLGVCRTRKRLGSAGDREQRVDFDAIQLLASSASGDVDEPVQDGERRGPAVGWDATVPATRTLRRIGGAQEGLTIERIVARATSSACRSPRSGSRRRPAGSPTGARADSVRAVDRETTPRRSLGRRA